MTAKMTENIMTTANSHCESMNKVMVPKNTNQSGSAWQASVEFIYSCVDKDDPENQRPVWGKAADTNVIIEKQIKQ